MPLNAIQHPLIAHKIALLRQYGISTKQFRELANKFEYSWLYQYSRMNQFTVCLCIYSCCTHSHGRERQRLCDLTPLPEGRIQVQEKHGAPVSAMGGQMARCVVGAPAPPSPAWRRSRCAAAPPRPPTSPPSRPPRPRSTAFQCRRCASQAS